MRSGGDQRSAIGAPIRASRHPKRGPNFWDKFKDLRNWSNCEKFQIYRRNEALELMPLKPFGPMPGSSSRFLSFHSTREKRSRIHGTRTFPHVLAAFASFVSKERRQHVFSQASRQEQFLAQDGCFRRRRSCSSSSLGIRIWPVQAVLDTSS